MTNLKEKYNKEIVPAMQKKFSYKGKLDTPKLEKVIINIGINQKQKDGQYIKALSNILMRISGQKPIETKAKKSIASFKIREGMIVGMTVTIRGRRMYDFVEKLIHITLPRVRDFRGLDTRLVDKGGNLNIGFREHIAFPEIKSDEVEKIYSLQTTIVSSAKTRKEGLELFRLFGFPIKKA